MKTLRRAALWGALGLFAVLLIASVSGAMAGAERAAGMFNSTPAALAWALLAGLLLMTLFLRSIHRSPARILLHVAPVLILAGAFLGSAPGHRFLGCGKIREGFMVIAVGRSDDRVLTPDLARIAGRMPFHVRLDHFELEQGTSSRVTILREGAELERAAIEINRPLHCGGYHLYQKSFGVHGVPYTILEVRSDSGLWLVYAGFVALGAGAFAWGWAQPVAAFLRRKRHVD